jgi:hypothetical protein
LSWADSSGDAARDLAGLVTGLATGDREAVDAITAANAADALPLVSALLAAVMILLEEAGHDPVVWAAAWREKFPVA